VDPNLDPQIYASEIWIRIRIRIQEAQKHTDPTDPDPQHCCAKNAIDTDFHAPGEAVSSPENPNGLEKYFWSS
jgi:hypothetical protein